MKPESLARLLKKYDGKMVRILPSVRCKCCVDCEVAKKEDGELKKAYVYKGTFYEIDFDRERSEFNQVSVTQFNVDSNQVRRLELIPENRRGNAVNQVIEQIVKQDMLEGRQDRDRKVTLELPFYSYYRGSRYRLPGDSD